uniref:Uncharacterized protein n=1 Tax=Rhizophora mucronata TaxID=61149 RepID=A0A2P2R527_RHIMU
MIVLFLFYPFMFSCFEQVSGSPSNVFVVPI